MFSFLLGTELLLLSYFPSFLAAFPIKDELITRE